MKIPAVAFVAGSGTGKTTLIEKVIKELKRRNYKVGAVKSDAHRFEIDYPGKDSYRMQAAGADATLVCSSSKLAYISRLEGPPSIDELLNGFFRNFDIVLVEGYKTSALPKIRVLRCTSSQESAVLTEALDETFIAVVSNAPLKVELPVLNLDAPELVADFLEKTFLAR